MSCRFSVSLQMRVAGTMLKIYVFLVLLLEMRVASTVLQIRVAGIILYTRVACMILYTRVADTIL